jgi:adiponectin receptor
MNMTIGDQLSLADPVIPSLVSYVIGLIFYATHFPECIIPEKMRYRLDHMGLGNFVRI